MGSIGVAQIAIFASVLLALTSRAAPVSAAGTTSSAADASTLARLLLGIAEPCASNSTEIWACLSQRAERWAQRVLRMRNVSIVDGVSLVRTSRGVARSFENVGPLYRMLASFSLQVSPPAMLTDPVLLRDAVEEGRGKMKKYLKPLLLAFTAIKAFLFVAAVSTLALLAGKALLISKLALLFALMAAYKNYVAPKKKTVEVIKVPHVTHSHESHHHSSQSEGYHHHHQHEQQQHYSGGSEWESSYGGEEGGGGGGSSGGGGGSSGGGGDYYDRRRSDKGQMGVAATSASNLAFRGYRRDQKGVWSRRDDGAYWRGEEEAEGGREERSAPWRAVIGVRNAAIPGYEPSSTTWK